MPVIATLVILLFLLGAMYRVRTRGMSVENTLRTMKPLGERPKIEKLAGCWEDNEAFSSEAMSVKTILALYHRAGMLLRIADRFEQPTDPSLRARQMEEISRFKGMAVKARKAAILALFE